MSDDVVDTGLVTAAVTLGLDVKPEPKATVSLPALAEAAALPRVQMPDGWTLAKVAGLVSDLAHNMYELPYILKKHALSEEQYNYLQSNDFFKRALEAETLTWASANSVQRRLALQAALALENALPDISARLVKPNEPLGEIVALVKVFSEMAAVTGAKAAAAPQGPSEKFKIVINLGGDTVVNREATITASTVQQEPQGASPHPAIQSLIGTP